MKKILLWLMILGLCQSIFGLNDDRSYRTGLNFYSNGSYSQALNYMQRVDESNRNNADYTLMMGKIQLAMGNYSQAYEWLLRFKNEFKGQDVLIDEHILSTIKLAAEYVKYSKVEARVRRVPGRVNTIHSEYAPIVNADGDVMIFGSDRRSPFGKENIFISYFVENSWTEPVEIRELCTNRSETVGSLNEGNTLYIAGQYEEKSVYSSIYRADFQSSKWSTPVLISEVSSNFNDIQPFVFNNEVMFFASNRHGDNKTYNIYVSEYRNGRWTSPVMLDSNINTKGNEQTPFLSEDGQTLYFASDTHLGFGDFDIFKATKAGSSWTSWSKAENMGPIINSNKDDRYFFIQKGSHNAFFSSNRFNGMGLEDIYRFDMRAFDIEPSLEDLIISGYVVDNEDQRVSTNVRWSFVSANTPHELIVQSDQNGDFEFKVLATDAIKYHVNDDRFVAVEKDVVIPDRVPTHEVIITLERKRDILEISGRVTDNMLDAVQTNIKFKYNHNDKDIDLVVTTDDNGYYQISLPVIKSLSYNIDAEGYMAADGTFAIPANELKVKLDFILTKLVKDQVYEIENIEFDFGKATLRPVSFEVLDRLVSTMNNNPRMKIKIAGHTDNVGSKEINDRLSFQRAQAVADYLVSKNINKDRLTVAGYGFSHPLVSNDTPEGRAKNRRVEMTVLELN